MKKSLVLAMAMALGVTASAYAANPFSDVPAGHWAYDSVSKLAAAGIVQGYGDTTFGGDKLMTRYEMAEIVAKAMAKGANVDKLAAEFADELNALGVRVAKLEKKADNVKITGTIKAQAKSFHRDSVNRKNGVANSSSRLRSDITIKGQINEDWTYTALLRNEHYFEANGDGDNKKNAGEEGVNFQRAYVNGKVGGLKVQAGRYNFADALGGDIYNHRVDGVQVQYGKAIQLTGGYVQAAKGGSTSKGSDYMYYVNAAANLGKAAKLNVGYIRADQAIQDATIDPKATAKTDTEIIYAGLGMNLTKSLKLNAAYYHADLDGSKADKDGWTAALSYKGAKAAKAGSFGLMAKYYDMPAGAVISPGLTYDTDYNTGAGMKGYQVRAEYALAKGIVANVAYYDLEGKGAKNDVNKEVLMTEVVFSF